MAVPPSPQCPPPPRALKGHVPPGPNARYAPALSPPKVLVTRPLPLCSYARYAP